MRYLAMLLLLTVSTLSFAQTRAITVEDIWGTYVFTGDRVSGFNFLQDGRSFTRLEENEVVKYDLKTGNKTGALVSGADLPTDGGFDGPRKLSLPNLSTTKSNGSNQSAWHEHGLHVANPPIYKHNAPQCATSCTLQLRQDNYTHVYSERHSAASLITRE